MKPVAFLILMLLVVTAEGRDDVGCGAPPPEKAVDAQHTYPQAIFFVCDASDSMKANMPSLRRNLEKAIIGLRPRQQFNIALMRNGVTEVFDIEPVDATPQRKKAAIAFLNRTSAGGSRNLAGIELALRHHPRLLYLLVGSDFPAEPALARLRSFNEPYHTRVNFVLFADSSHAAGDWRIRFKQIAEENAGICKTVITNDPYEGPHNDGFHRQPTDPTSERDRCIPDGLENAIFVQSRHPRRIVFVVDVQRASLPNLPTILGEMQKAIAALSPDQSFNVIFSRPTAPRQMSEDLVPATRENKSRFPAMIGALSADRDNDPLPAIDNAFSLHPNMIYFISGRAFRDSQGVQNHIKRLNPEMEVEVNTIAYMEAYDHPMELIDSMRIIAEQNRGNFTRVDADELAAFSPSPIGR